MHGPDGRHRPADGDRDPDLEGPADAAQPPGGPDENGVGECGRAVQRSYRLGLAGAVSFIMSPMPTAEIAMATAAAAFAVPAAAKAPATPEKPAGTEATPPGRKTATGVEQGHTTAIRRPAGQLLPAPTTSATMSAVRLSTSRAAAET
jgi:hypothetical protein